MTKILIDGINPYSSKTVPINTNIFFREDIQIYPIDFVYCESYIKKSNLNVYPCYICENDIEFIPNKINNDFEIIYLSCGHLHHTKCLMTYSEEQIDKMKDYKDCKYCSSQRSVKKIKSKIEDAYYASILAYDFKHIDFKQQIDNIHSSNHTLRRSSRIEAKNELKNKLKI